MSQRSVLVVEDDPDVRELWRLIIIHAGYRCEVVTNGHEALDLLTTFTPDAIVMDWIMPAMTGLVALQAIRADRTLDRVPVVFVTAKTVPEDRRIALAAGAADYLTKPVRAAALVDTLARLVSLRKPE